MTESAFEGQHVLVTGGSRGIGRAAAIRFASEGANVSINYLSRPEPAEETLGQIKSYGRKAVAIPGDVSLPENAADIVAQARRALGPIDILVHCAGYSVVEPASQVTWESWKQTMNVNLDGTFNMIYAVKDEMLERRRGRIVTTSSVAALRQRKNQVHYSASKAAVIAMTRCLAEAWAEFNVRVNCVCPGLTETEMSYALSPEARQSVISQTPLGRVGTPDEIANVIRFLASDESSFMTGQTLVACGGRVMLPG
ncbi:MAG: 3-oxoacyl-[acyl-carrier-protein] reductase [Planctomycetaceae bacterium]|nr:3-oxoacyl-[acyl-carrier-protein] reductase [Planctomycetaceae bacterium]